MPLTTQQLGNFIPITDPSQALGQQLRALVQQLIQAGALCANLYQRGTQIQAGGTDFSGVEGLFGIPAGTGSALLGLLNTAQQALAAAPIQGLLTRVG